MKKTVLILMAFFAISQPVKAICVGTLMNPITDICWECFFPITLGGIYFVDGPTCETPIFGNTPICTCAMPPPIFMRFGVGMSFWEPARMVETVKDAYCFPSIGAQLGASLNDGHASAQEAAEELTFFHAHYLIFPAHLLLGSVTSAGCKTIEGFDIGYLTEIDPLWNEDELSSLIHPEAVLFANPLAQMACVADAIISNAYCSGDLMSWCMGSWGSVYPLTGNVSGTDYLEASSSVAARMIYKLSRQLLLWDHGLNVCSPMPSPIWKKTNYRLQMMKPIRDYTCHPIGRSSMIWGWGKSIPIKSANPVWLIWRHKGCCAG